MTFSYTMPQSTAEAARNIALCYYINPSADIQVLRIHEERDFYFEKVVFPRERLFFNAPRSSTLQVFSQDNAALSLNTIPCAQIQVRSGAV